jgi:hypothetical protein
MQNSMKAGERYLIMIGNLFGPDRLATEVRILEVSPSGNRVHFVPFGWVEMKHVTVVEQLASDRGLVGTFQSRGAA